MKPPLSVMDIYSEAIASSVPAPHATDRYNPAGYYILNIEIPILMVDDIVKTFSVKSSINSAWRKGNDSYETTWNDEGRLKIDEWWMSLRSAFFNQ